MKLSEATAPIEVTVQPAFIWRPRLSEAIREGAKLRPQSTGAYFTFDDNNKCIGSCAVGAAIEAVLGKVPDDGSDDEDRAAMALGLLQSGNAGSAYITLWDEITKRNDEQGWTREAIADWLEGQGY